MNLVMGMATGLISFKMCWWSSWLKRWIGYWRWSCIYKYANYEVNEDNGNSVYWDIYKSVGYKYGKDNNGEVDSDVDAKIGSGDGELF